MSVVEAYPLADPSLRQIISQLCCALSPVRALRRLRRRVPRQPSPDESGTPSGRALLLQNTIPLLDVSFSIAETIPVFGTLLKGALEAFCKVLRLIEQNFENAEGIDEFTGRLNSLFEAIRSLEGSDPRVGSLVVRLHAIAAKLAHNTSKKGVRVQAVARALADGSVQVDRCLMDFNTEAQLRMMAVLRVTEVERIAMECVTVIDPFGMAQRMLLTEMSNVDLVARIILNRYDGDVHKKKALGEFISVGLYELTMDDGHYIEPLSDGSKLSVSHRGTVMMSIVILKIIKDQEELRCPKCKGPMPFADGDDREVCTTCNRRVSAIKSKDPSADAGKQVQHIASIETLFRNILIKHTSTTSHVEVLSEVEDEQGQDSAIRDEPRKQDDAESTDTEGKGLDGKPMPPLSARPAFSRSGELLDETPDTTRLTPAERRSARAKHNAWRLKEIQHHKDKRLKRREMEEMGNEADDERRDVAIHDPRMFNPSRYLATRRAQTLSIISHEAQGGTVANTVVGSPTAFTLSTAPFLIPDKRDPLRAVEEWRNQLQEEAQAVQRAKRKRRPRPGVVFDVKEDPDEENKPRPGRISATRDKRAAAQSASASASKHAAFGRPR